MDNAVRSPMEWIRRVAGRIASAVRPLKIVLFGSHAYGRPKRDSDLDILVVMPSRVRDRFAGYMRVEKAVGEHVWPLDILVRGADEVESRLRIGDSFMRKIMNRGKVLYAAPSRRK